MVEAVEAVPRGYTTIEMVQTYMGQTFDTDIERACQTLICAVELYIDNYTNRSWLTGPITLERYDLIWPVIYLISAPVTSVSLVQTRSQFIGEQWRILNAGVDYELIDVGLGQINLVTGYGGPRAIAQVSYVPNRPVPNDVQHAATLLVANSLQLPLYPERLGMERIRVGDVMSFFGRQNTSLNLTTEADAILDSYIKPILA